MTMRRGLAIVGALALARGLGATGPAAAEELSASDVWFRLRDAYAQLVLYRDEGELEMDDVGAGVARFAVSTRLDAEGRVHFEARPAAGPAASLIAERRRGPPAGGDSRWKRDLEAAVGAGAVDGLPPVALLIGGPLAIEEPEALALDGNEACGETRCHVLVGTTPSSAAAWRLWVDERAFLVRRSEVELRRGAAVRIFRLALRPQAETALLPGEVYAESIDVTLSRLVVRVRGPRGEPVSDLQAADFRLQLGGREVEVESVEWVGEEPPSAPPAELPVESLAELSVESAAVPRAGRLILFFVQASFEPSRMLGQMQMRQHARRFLDGLRAEDLVAVVSFDSHLKLRADFSRDRDRTAEALDAGLRTGPEPLLRPEGSPSLLRHFDRKAAKRAATAERGLEVAARALVPIEGEKVVVYLGWGLGRLVDSGVQMRPEYQDALRALDAARASVFALDVTMADYHSLEVGLERVAADTGGTYAKTHQFPGQAIARLEATLAGHYVLYFRRPEGAQGAARVRVELADPRRGEILAPEAARR